MNGGQGHRAEHQPVAIGAGPRSPVDRVGWRCRPVCLQIVYTDLMASEETTTVRIRRPDSERLQVLAQRRHTSVVEVVHNAIEALERQDFLRGLASDYEHLRSDSERWEQYVHEREEWDSFA
jgi:hypothetical protein